MEKFIKEKITETEHFQELEKKSKQKISVLFFFFQMISCYLLNLA